MSIRRTFLTATILAAAACSSAKANVVFFDNLANSAGGGPSNSWGIASDAVIGQSFSTGADVGTGDLNVAVTLENSSFSSAGSFVITLNSNVGVGAGAPGAVVATLGTFLDTSVAGTALVHGWLAGNPLAINTRYWIEVTDVGGDSLTTVAWDFANDAIGGGSIGAVGESNYVDSTVDHYANSGPLLMSVDAPEPATIALLGAGLAGLGWVRRRAAKKA